MIDNGKNSFNSTTKKRWRDMGAAFKIRNYRWYWTTQFLSGIGTWAQAIAQSWLILDLTHSAIALGIITMLQFFPMLLFSLFGGVVADRFERRQLLVFTQIILALQAIILSILVITHNITILEVGFLALLLGTTNALNGPAQQAFVPELVGKELVPNAVALNSVQFNTSRMIGGAIGGIAIALWGIPGALFFNAASFIPTIIVLIVIRPAYTTIKTYLKKTSAITELKEGLGYSLSNLSIRKIVLLFGVIGLLGFNWQVAVPLIARFSLHKNVTAFGDLMAALGAGSLIGAIIQTRNSNASEKRIILGGIALGISLLLLGLSHSYILSLLLLVIAGFSGIIASVTTNTRLQLITPDKFRGRIMGIYILLMGGTTPIGAFLFGEIAGNFNTGIALMIFGGITVLAIAIIAITNHHIETNNLVSN
ncbi:MAG: MFS transporter [Patescibacteria group bacterium]